MNNAASIPSIAFVHDWLDTWAGGENVLAELTLLFPEAPVFTLVDFFPEALRARLGARDIRPSFLQRLPFARTSFRRYLPLFPRAIESLDVSAFDLIVSSSHAVAKGVRTHARQLHVCYCYSPMRYAWDLREQYLAQVGLHGGLRSYAGRIAFSIASPRGTCARARGSNAFVAISKHIADADPALLRARFDRDLPSSRSLPTAAPETAARPGFVRDGVAGSCRTSASTRSPRHSAALPDRELVIVGEGPERARVAAAAGPNVRLAGQLDDAAA